MSSSISFIANVPNIKHTLKTLARTADYEPVRIMSQYLLDVGEDSPHLWDMSDDNVDYLYPTVDLSGYFNTLGEVVRWKLGPSHLLMISSGDLGKDDMRNVFTFADIFDCYALTKSSNKFALEHDLTSAISGNMCTRSHVFHVLAELFADYDMFGDIDDKREYLRTLHIPSIVDGWDDATVLTMYIDTLANDLAWLNDAIMQDVQLIQPVNQL